MFADRTDIMNIVEYDPAWAMQGLEIRAASGAGQYGSPAMIGRYEDSLNQSQHSGGGNYMRTQSPMAAWFDSDVWLVRLHMIISAVLCEIHAYQLYFILSTCAFDCRL